MLRSAPPLVAAVLWFSAASAGADPPGSRDACLSSYESAQRLRLESKLRAARSELIACAKSECPSVLRRDCATWLGEVDRALPSVVIAATAGSEEVADVRVLVDGAALADSLDGSELVVDPGARLFRFEREGSQPVEQKLTIRAGEKNRLVEVDFGGSPGPTPSEPGAERNLLPVYGLTALGGLAVASFGFFALRSHSEREDLKGCKGHCPAEDVDRVRRDQLIADISLGVGLVALGAAAYLYFSAPAEPRQASWQLGATALPGGGAAALHGRF